MRHETFASSSASRYESRAIASRSRSDTEGCDAACLHVAWSQPPGHRDRPQRHQPGRGRKSDVDPHHVRRQVQFVLNAADEPLRSQEHAERRERLHHALGAATVAREQPHQDHRDSVQRRDHSVLMDHPGQRVGALEVQPVHMLARNATGVRSSGGRGGAGEDRQRAEQEQPADRPDDRTVIGTGARPGFVGAAPGERDGRDQDHHREAEMGHHEPRREVLEDGEAAEHGLRHDAERQQQRQPREVPAVRSARERQDRGDHRDHADDSRNRAVAELDQRMGAERRQRRAAALGPVLTAEPRIGQPHGGAGQDDQRQRRERDVGDASELGRGNGDPVKHGHRGT